MHHLKFVLGFAQWIFLRTLCQNIELIIVDLISFVWAQMLIKILHIMIEIYWPIHIQNYLKIFVDIMLSFNTSVVDIRCRVYTPLRVERRWDHWGLGPKSKRRKGKTENRSRQRTDYAENRWLHGDTDQQTQRTRTENDTDRDNNEYVLKNANN